MMKEFKKLLKDLEDTLSALNSPLLKKLNQGLKQWPSNQLPAEFPKEIEHLYKWRNGTKITGMESLGELWLFNFGYFLSLEEAIINFNDTHFDTDKWDQYKFPLFASGGGEFYLLECNRSVAEFGMIYYFSIGDIDFDTMISIYDSLSSFIQTIQQCYCKQAYYYSSNGSLEFDHLAEFKISKKLNPKSKYWDLMAGLFVE